MYGSAEAYVTPEGGYGFLNDPKLPWETCLTMGDSWAFTNNTYDTHNVYKNASNVVQTLVDVVAKGGNLLMDIGPDEHGLFPRPAVQAMEEVGAWLDVHGEAIYGARWMCPAQDSCLTFVPPRTFASEKRSGLGAWAGQGRSRSGRTSST